MLQQFKKGDKAKVLIHNEHNQKIGKVIYVDKEGKFISLKFKDGGTGTYFPKFNEVVKINEN